MSEAVLDVEDVSIAFGGLKAVQHFSLSLPMGGLYGLIGPNGAGKTTAFNLLTGVYRPDSGAVRVAGKRVDGRKPHQIAYAGLARTFQNIRLFGELSVLDNVRLGRQMRHPHGMWTTMLRSGGYMAAERTIDIQSHELLAIFGSDTKELTPNRPLRILNVDWEGNFSTFCPELTAATSEKYGNFVMGNILTDRLESIFDNEVFKLVNAEVDAGLKMCELQCEYWQYCGGGEPSSKFFQHRRFDVMETTTCKIHKQGTVDAVLEYLEHRLAAEHQMEHQ